MWLGKRLSMVAAAFLALMLFVVALGQSPSTGVVKKNANLRAGPGTTYAIAGTATAGQAVTVIGKSAAGDWYELKDGQWIAAFLVTVDAAGTPAGTSVVTSPTATAVVLADLQKDPVFNAYADGAKPIFALYTDASNIIIDHFTQAGADTSLMFTKDWRDGVEVGLLEFKKVSEDIRKLTPPAYLVAAHGDLLKMADRLDSAVALLGKGLDNFNADQIKQGAAEFDAATALLNSSKAKIEAFAATVVTTAPAVKAQAVVTPVPSPTNTPAAAPAPTENPLKGQRSGAACRDGTTSSATGRGACSRHGGVDHWLVY